MYRCALFKGDFSKGCPVWQPKKLKWVICNVSLLNDLIVWVKNKTLTEKRWSEHHTILTTQNIKNECCLLSISRGKKHLSLGFIWTWLTTICSKWLRLCVCYHLSHGHSVMGSNRNVQWLSALQQHSFPSLLSLGPVSLSSRYSRSNGF